MSLDNVCRRALESSPAMAKVRLSVKQAELAYEQASRTAGAIDAIEEGHAIARLRYESGFGTFLEAATAEALLKSTEASAIRSGFDLETARDRFEFVMEGGRPE